WHPSLAPVLVIADPETTVGLPRGLTAATGMDALSHAIEAYSAKGFHPMCDGIAIEAMRLVRKSLVRACEEPTDLEARSDMLVAASMGAVAFQKGLGVLHAIAHPLGGLTDLHHGTLNAILLPHVIRYNRQALVERADRLARWLDLDAPRHDAERSGTSPVGWGVDALLAWVDDLRSRLAIPARLADLGVSPDVIPEVARRAPEDPSFANNPITPTQADLEGILRAAIEGG
ncbi:MAG: iron-containing alcohol dehydrogenase, partial [Deltaproteobacteria bacterium]|nr:iron-containing alcohol dehydrogenase [Deltaproteobacteria bacterium]